MQGTYFRYLCALSLSLLYSTELLIQALQSSLEISANAETVIFSMSSLVVSSSSFMEVLTLENASSMGFKSGE